jgi:Flp pilus assembly protein TadD
MKKSKVFVFSLVVMSVLNACQMKSEKESSGEAGKDLSLKERESAEQKQKILTGTEASSEKIDRPESVTLEPASGVSASKSSFKSQVPDNLAKPLQEAVQAQNNQEILRTASSILALYPKDLTALNALAMAHYRSGRHTMAKFFLNKAIRISSQHSALHSNYALVLMAQGERREAMQSMKRALSIDSKDIVVNANLGSLYVKERDYQKALPLLERAYLGGLSDPRVLNNYGAALAVTGQHQKALELYKRVLDRDSSSKETVLNLALLQVVYLKNMTEGREVLDRLKAMSPPSEWRNLIKDLENRVEVGLK